jgi:hypothetical protein
MGETPANTSAAGGEWEKKTGDRRSEYRSQKSESRRRETALMSANYGCEGPKPKKTEDRSQKSGGRSQEAEDTELPRTPNGEP